MAADSPLGLTGIRTRLSSLFGLRRDALTPEYQSLLNNFFGIEPGNLAYYRTALHHRSSREGDPALEIYERWGGHPSLPSNERLEFIGDAAIGLAVKEHLFRTYPEMDEGMMTQVYSCLVSRESLNALASLVGLTALLLRSNAKLRHQVDHAQHIGGNALEALCGAIYLDKGYPAFFKSIEYRIFPEIVNWDYYISNRLDPKSHLLQLEQSGQLNVQFDTFEREPNTGRFISRLLVDGEEVLSASGTSKREAEKRVAALYIERMDAAEEGALEPFMKPSSSC